MKQFFLLFAAFLLITNFNFAQSQETASEVKELKEFHKVIYKIWHNAWPKKDISMLQTLLPEVENGAVKLANAQLPGILRDKKDKWELGISEFNNCVNNYKNACNNRDSVQLLNSAEKLHSQYESLVRIIKPITKEIDQFHQELYLLYHYYLPNNNYDKITNSAIMLNTMILDLKNAALPEKLSDKKIVFDNATSDLETAVHYFTKVSNDRNDMDEIKKSIIEVHNKYQSLEKIFD